MKKRDVLDKAIVQFRENTGINIVIEDQMLNLNQPYDAYVKIKWEDLEFDHFVDIKSTFNRAVLGIVNQYFHTLEKKGLLCTKYVNPRLADELRQANIPFIDTAGNAFINDPPLYVFITGRKPLDWNQKEQPPRIFRAAGLKILFILLCHPGLENAPYRELAQKANVALGTVSWTMYDLRKMGYLIDQLGKKRRLVRKKDLLNRWVIEYAEQLRPKNMIGRFRVENKDWWKHIQIKDFNAYWGGEVAAYYLTDYLKPQTITIYTLEPLGKLILKNKLIKDPTGNIEILKMFWNLKPTLKNVNLVHPLLVYADLLAKADSRNIDAARIIYEKEITELIRED